VRWYVEWLSRIRESQSECLLRVFDDRSGAATLFAFPLLQVASRWMLAGRGVLAFV